MPGNLCQFSLVIILLVCLGGCNNIRKENSESASYGNRELESPPVKTPSVSDESSYKKNGCYQTVIIDGKEICYDPEKIDGGIDIPGPGISPATSFDSDAEKNVMKYCIDLPTFIQETDYYCVPACVQMILHLHGTDISQNELAAEMNTSVSTGTEYADAVMVLNKYLFGYEIPSEGEDGYRVQDLAYGNMDETLMSTFDNRLRQDIKNRFPVLIAGNLKYLYPDRTDFPSANHMILITGYITDKSNNSIMNYYGVDPYSPVQDPVYNGLKIFSRQEIQNAMIYNNFNECAYIW